MNSAQTPSPVTPTAQPTGAIQPQTQTPQATTPKPPDPYPTVADVMKVCPDADINSVRKNLPYILKEMAAGGLTTKEDLIAVLCTVYVETTTFAPRPEEGRGGGKHGVYYGRGYVQITWKENYEAFGKTIGIDLVSNPDRALEPEIAAKALVWYFKTNNIPAYARKGDYDNVRSIINAGSPGRINICWGVPVYRGAVQRALQIIKSGIDPKAVGAIPLDGSYGLGCVDPGSAGSRTLTGVHNPTTQADALAYALGLHMRERDRSHELNATINVASVPEMLELDAQKTFDVKGFGAELDGTFTTDEIVFYPLDPRGLIAELHAFKPDPNAPPPQIFLHNSQAGLNPTQPAIASNIPAGEIPQKIYQAAIAAKGKSTANGPDYGNKACCYAVNNLCLIPAGLRPIGSNPNLVPSAVEDLEKGRGKKIDPGQAVPGDIWVSNDMAHIGICMTAGCTEVLSNSSSKASFAWQDSRTAVDSSYEGPAHGIYRIVS